MWERDIQTLHFIYKCKFNPPKGAKNKIIAEDSELRENSTHLSLWGYSCNYTISHQHWLHSSFQVAAGCCCLWSSVWQGWRRNLTTRTANGEHNVFEAGHLKCWWHFPLCALGTRWLPKTLKLSLWPVFWPCWIPDLDNAVIFKQPFFII